MISSFKQPLFTSPENPFSKPRRNFPSPTNESRRSPKGKLSKNVIIPCVRVPQRISAYRKSPSSQYCPLKCVITAPRRDSSTRSSTRSMPVTLLSVMAQSCIIELVMGCKDCTEWGWLVLFHCFYFYEGERNNFRSRYGFNVVAGLRVIWRLVNLSDWVVITAEL